MFCRQNESFTRLRQFRSHSARYPHSPQTDSILPRPVLLAELGISLALVGCVPAKARGLILTVHRSDQNFVQPWRQ